jgi:hypothetical protein
MSRVAEQPTAEVPARAREDASVVPLRRDRADPAFPGRHGALFKTDGSGACWT